MDDGHRLDPNRRRPDVEGDGDGLTWQLGPVIKRRDSRRDRGSIVIALVAAVLALAILKPWGTGQSQAPSTGPGPVRSAAAPVLTSPAPAAPSQEVIADQNAMLCLTHQSEQVMTLERWPDREIKSWSEANGASLTLPDAGTPAILVASSHVVGIGVCPGIGPVGRPAAGGEPTTDPLVWSAAEILAVRRISPDGSAVDLGAPPQITVQTDYVAAGVLYGPPPSSSSPSGGPSESGGPTTGGSRAWGAGRYALGYTYPGDPNREFRWVVVDIRTPLHDS